MSGWLSQDSLGKIFSCQRQQRKSGDNPNGYEFCKNTQALWAINTVCGNVPRGNCRGNKSDIDWEAESKLLPKYRKAGRENRPPSTYVCNRQSLLSESDCRPISVSTSSQPPDPLCHHQPSPLKYNCELVSVSACQPLVHIHYQPLK